MYRKNIKALLIAIILIFGIASMSFAAIQHTGLPRMDDVSFKVIKTEDASVDALMTGEVDCIAGPNKLENIEKVTDAGFGQTWDASASYGHCQIQCRDVFPEEAGEIAGMTCAPLDDSNWRKMLTYVFGMDRKSTSIYEYYGGPQTFAAENIIPSAQAFWYSPEYRFPDTDLDYAWTILQDAGYYVTDGVLYNPDDTPVRDQVALYSADALAWEKIAGDFVKYLNEFMDYIGATVSPEFSIHPEDFWTLVYKLLEYHDFDYLFIGLTNLGPDPQWMQDMFHKDYIGSWYWNTVGLEDDYATELMEIIWHNMDVDTVLQACHDWQDYFREIVPHFPMTWTYTISTYHPELEDYIATKCYGSTLNEHTWSSLHWTDTTGGLLRRALGDEPSNLHPWFEDTSYGRQMMDLTFGSHMVSSEPNTLKKIPWIAYDWSMEVVEGGWPELGITGDGTKIVFELRNDVTWHDGTPLTAQDAKFHLDMYMKYQPPRYAQMWEGLVYVETDGDYKLTIYYEGTSLWQLDNALNCLYTPKHIWSVIDEMVEDGAFDGDIKKFDPQTPYEDIMLTSPPAEYPYMKAGLVGCGPYVWDYYDASLMVGEVHKYEDYWVQSPVEAAVDAYYRVDPDGTLNYSIVLLNTGAIGESLANATVDAEVYVDDALVQTITSTTVPFLDYVRLGPFTTDALAYGEHTISVKVFEGDELIDTYEHAVSSTIKQDTNLDLHVNILDLAAAAGAFGSHAMPYHVRWNPIADMDDNFRIDILDVADIARHFGWPEK